MECKLKNLEIPEKDPFLNCQLDRKKYASILKTIVESYQEGCVLAINGKWGTGKTTFVQMWAQSLKEDNFHTLYFNAWENDFISDPLVGLLGELKKVSSEMKVKDALLSAINTAGKIVLKAAPSIAKEVLKKYVGEGIVDICSDSVEEGSSLLKKEIENYENQKQCLRQFHIDLSKFVKEVCDQKPLVFIVDELDRCNPCYAVKVLERIKHFFNISKIVFVLSIDKQQLSNSIRGYYGSDLIDADEYLKRFIDIEYALPDPDVDKFTSYLYQYYDFNAFFGTVERAKSLRLSDEKENLLEIAQALFKHKKLTLRQIEKIFSNTRLSLKMFAYNQEVYPELLFLLTYFRICESDFYEKICHRDFDIQGLIDKIEDIVPKQIFIMNERYNKTSNVFFIYTIARLLGCYTMNDNVYTHETLITEKEQNKDRDLIFTVQFIDKKVLVEALESLEYRHGNVCNLSNITKKISLLENFKI